MAVHDNGRLRETCYEEREERWRLIETAADVGGKDGMQGRNMMRWVGAASAVCIGLNAASAHAQQLAVSQSLAVAAQDEAVMSRSRPDYDAVGISVDGFRVFPSLEGALEYDDNIYNSDNNKRADESFIISPKVEVQSQWDRHALNLSAGGAFDRYFKLGSEDTDQYNFDGNGRLDITHAIALDLDGSFARRAEARGSFGDVIIGGEPSRYNDAAAKGKFVVQFANVTIAAGGGVEDFNYLPIHINDVVFSQNYRDRLEADGSLRLDYAVGPGLRAFVAGTYNNQNYRERVDGIEQDSHGYDVLGGVNFGLTHLLSGEIGIGYISQKYVQPGFGTIGGFSYEGKLVWNPTALVTLTAAAAKTLQQSPLTDQQGILEDNLSLKVDYELLRNLILSLRGSGVFDRYKGIDRRDRLYVADFNVRYLINRALEAGLLVNHRHQGSLGIIGRKYSGSSVSFSLTVKR